MQIFRENKLTKFICGLFFSLLTITTVFIPYASAVTINWGSIKYDVSQLVTVRTGLKNAIRTVEYLLLKGCCQLIDMFERAIDKIISINLYSLIKDKFNITTVVYPVAWALASLAVIIAVIIFIINADKMRTSDFYRNLFCSLLILIALPTLVSSLSSLRSSGVKDVKNSFTTEAVYNDDTTVSSQTLGETLLANYIYVVDKSLQKNKICKYSDTTNFTSNPATVYTLSINDTLSTDTYNRKTDGTIPPASAQKKYDDLNLLDKLRLLDDEFSRTSSSSGGKSTLVNTYESWAAKDQRYIQYNSNTNTVYAKSGGGTAKPSEIWCRYMPYNDFTFYQPYSQVFEGDTIYTDRKNTQEIKEPVPYYSDWDRIDYSNWSNYFSQLSDAEKSTQWYSYWEYHRVNAWNYQRLLVEQLNTYFITLHSDESIPSEFKNLFSADWINRNIVNSASIEEAVSNIESARIELENYGKTYSLIEYLNLEDNYKAYINGEVDNGSADFIYLFDTADYDELGDFDKVVRQILTTGYPVEALYQLHISFGYGLIMMLVTLVCLIFAGLKLTGLLYDVVFAQIIAPLVVATDLQGAGRAKQVVMNLISCNICFIVVIFLLRLYLWIVMTAQNEFSFLVVLFLILAGAKFVIDGPDLIVKLLGIDAGIKSGAATLMGLRSAGQIATGAVRGAKGIATAPAHIARSAAIKAGQAKAAKEDIQKENGIGNKLQAAAANTGLGQAFRQGANSQKQTNDNYRGNNANNFGDSMSTQATVALGSLAGRAAAINDEAQSNIDSKSTESGGKLSTAAKVGEYAKAAAGNTAGQPFRRSSNAKVNEIKDSISANSGGIDTKAITPSIGSSDIGQAFKDSAADTRGRLNSINNSTDPTDNNSTGRSSQTQSANVQQSQSVSQESRSTSSESSERKENSTSSSPDKINNPANAFAHTDPQSANIPAMPNAMASAAIPTGSAPAAPQNSGQPNVNVNAAPTAGTTNTAVTSNIQGNTGTNGTSSNVTVNAPTGSAPAAPQNSGQPNVNVNAAPTAGTTNTAVTSNIQGNTGTNGTSSNVTVNAPTGSAPAAPQNSGQPNVNVNAAPTAGTTNTAVTSNIQGNTGLNGTSSNVTVNVPNSSALAAPQNNGMSNTNVNITSVSSVHSNVSNNNVNTVSNSTQTTTNNTQNSTVSTNMQNSVNNNRISNVQKTEQSSVVNNHLQQGSNGNIPSTTTTIHGKDGRDGANGYNGRDGMNIKGDKGDRGETAQPDKNRSNDPKKK